MEKVKGMFGGDIEILKLSPYRILKKISEFRNLKISQEIKRNTYIVALNNAIDYTFEENNLEFEKNILIKV